MTKIFDTHRRKPIFCTISVLIILLITPSAHAVNHIINFGGVQGFNYSPKKLNVSVGDSITWQGVFSGHPLSSTSVPQGAITFHNESGNSFTYLVQVAGDYNYECDFHTGLGMIGSINASVTDIAYADRSSQPASFHLAQNHPNPFNPQTEIKFSLSSAQHVKLKVYAITGAEVATLVDKMLPAGKYSTFYNAGDLASGIYFYRLISDKFVDTKRMILAK